MNARIDKTSYLDSAFSLTFPFVDDITTELMHLGCWAFLYKVDVTWAFQHVKLGLGDYDLLCLEWPGFYVDTLSHLESVMAAKFFNASEMVSNT